MNCKKIFMFATGMAAAFALNAQEAVVTSLEESMDFVEADMVFVQGGSFLMGSKNNEDNETPVHEVTVADFNMMNTEVTQGLYRKIMGTNVSHFKGDERPVEEVSWYDAIVFCNKLSEKAGLTPVYTLDGSSDTSTWGSIPRIDADEAEKARWNSIAWNTEANGYRLPTEAEWEYAAKGGVYAAFDTIYSGSNVITDVAWNADDPSGETHDVALKTPNTLGLFDMSGNVWEWVWDWYGNYHVADSDNPKGASAEITGRKMRRGGSINSDAVFCRNANRASSVPELRGVDLGFRIVRSAFDETVAVVEEQEETVAADETVVPEEPAESTEEEKAPLVSVEINEDGNLELDVNGDTVVEVPSFSDSEK